MNEPPLLDREEVLAKLYQRVVAYAARRVGPEDAEDLAQETLILLRKKYAHLETYEDLIKVAMTTAGFKVRGVRRDRGRRKTAAVDELPLVAGGADPERVADRRQYLATVLAALRELPERCRELIRMKAEGVSWREIGKRLGARTLGTVYTWNHRCRKQLHETIDRLQGIRT